MAKDQSDILKEILKNSKNPKAIEQAQAGLDEAKQARKAEIASQMKGSLSSTIAKSEGPVNESTRDSDNIKQILKESKEQNTNLKSLIRLNEKSIEDNSELFGRLEKTMNAIVDALQEQKRQQSQTTSQTAPSNVSVPSVGPAAPSSDNEGGFNLTDLLPDFSSKDKNGKTPNAKTSAGKPSLLRRGLKVAGGLGAGALLGGAAYGLMSPEQQEKAKELLGDNADSIMAGGGAVAGGLLGTGAAGKILGKVATPLTVAAEGYQSYQQYNEVDEKLKKGEITKNDADVLKTKAVTGGIGGASGALAGASTGAMAGAALGSVVPVIGTAIGGVVGGIGGGLLGAYGGRALGEAVPGLAGMQTEEEQKKYAEKTAAEQKKIAQQKAQDNGEQYDEIPAGHQKPRPSNPMQAQVWDSKYASGWNADGTPKGKVEPQPAPEPVLSDKEALEKKMNEPQDTFSKGSSKEAIEKRMNEPQDTFSIGAVNYAKQKFDEAVPEFNRGTSGSLEAQNLPENVMKLMKEKGISYNEANKILRGEVESKDPNAFMMATNAISAKSNMELKSTNRDEDYSSAVETPTYDAMGNYSGPDIKTEYEKAGKRIERKSSEGIVSNKSSFGSEFLGGLLSKQGLQTGSFMGNTMKEKQGTNVEGVEDEKSMDIAHILGIRKSGGIFGTDEYDVHYGNDSLKVSKSEYMRMQQYVADGDPERAMALFNELNKKNKKDIEASPIFKAQQEQMNEAVKQGDYKSAMNVAMNRTEDDFPTPTNETPIPSVESKPNDNGDSASRIERKKEIKAEQTRPKISVEEKAKQLAINEDDAKDVPKASRASKWIQDLAAKHRVDPDDLEFGMNHPNIDVKADIAAGKAGVDTPEGIKAAMNAKNIESTGPNGEKLSKLEQSGQAQNQAPIVLNGGDTVNNVVTNNNTSSGGSGGGAGSPSRIASPFDRIMFPNVWGAHN